MSSDLHDSNLSTKEQLLKEYVERGFVELQKGTEVRLKLRVSSLNKETLEKTFILAEINYVYEDKYGTTIIITKPKETAEGTGVIQAQNA